VVATAPAVVTEAPAERVSTANTPEPRKRTKANEGAFFAIGPSAYLVSYKHVPAGTDKSKSFLGGVVNAGFYVFKQNRLSFDVGAYYAQDKVEWYGYTGDRLYVDTYDRVLLPLLVTWNYEFDFSESFHLRVGPTAGGTLAIISSKVDGKHDSDSSFVFTYGANVGLTWNVSETFFLDFGYRLLWNTAAKYDFGKEKTIRVHQLNFTAGWRF
jgi:opacity protein-like surface antigen